MRIHQLGYVMDKDHATSRKIDVIDGDRLFDPKEMLDRTQNYYFIYSIQKDNGEILSMGDYTTKGMVQSFEDYGKTIVTKYGKYHHDNVEKYTGRNIGEPIIEKPIIEILQTRINELERDDLIHPSSKAKLIKENKKFIAMIENKFFDSEIKMSSWICGLSNDQQSLCLKGAKWMRDFLLK